MTIFKHSTLSGALAAYVDASLMARIVSNREAIEKFRADLSGRVASAQVAASKYTEDLGKFEGRAREIFEAKLRVETGQLVAAERQLAETERDCLDLEVADREAEWIDAALRDFARVWKVMKPENQGRLLRALVAAVLAKEETGVVEVELVDFAPAADSKESA